MDANDRAIAHLFEALMLLACVRDQGDTSSVPIHIGPADTGHTVHVTAKTAEAIADAVDSMNASLNSEDPDYSAIDELLRQTADAVTDAIPVDPERMARSTARFTGWLESQAGEAIESGEFSAAAVAQYNPDLYADVTDLFDGLDLVDITRQVLDEPVASKLTVTLALDSLLGEIGDTYLDEDDA